MTTVIDSLIVTDDEFCAISWVTGVPVPRPLETVDVRDPQRFTAAVGRGMRSMLIRSDVDGDEDSFELVRRAFQDSWVISIAGLDGSGNADASVPLFVVLATDAGDSLTAWTTLGGGLHKLAVTSLTMVVDGVADMVCTSDDGVTVGLRIRDPGSGGDVTLAVGHGTVRVLNGDVRHTLPQPSATGWDRPEWSNWISRSCGMGSF